MSNHSNITDSSFPHSFKPRHLPHLFDEYKCLFITYCLKFSDNSALMLEWQNIKLAELKRVANETGIPEHDSDVRLFNWFDERLANDKEIPRILQDPHVAQIVGNAFKHFDQLRYNLIAYSIMPNHIHVLISPTISESEDLYSPSRTIYTWKRFTANEINKHLGRIGALWQKDYYDILLHDQQSIFNTIEYILNNPVKAVLVDNWEQWKGNYVNYRILGIY